MEQEMKEEFARRERTKWEITSDRIGDRPLLQVRIACTSLRVLTHVGRVQKALRDSERLLQHSRLEHRICSNWLQHNVEAIELNRSNQAELRWLTATRNDR